MSLQLSDLLSEHRRDHLLKMYLFVSYKRDLITTLEKTGTYITIFIFHAQLGISVVVVSTSVVVLIMVVVSSGGSNVGGIIALGGPYTSCGLPHSGA